MMKLVILINYLKFLQKKYNREFCKYNNEFKNDIDNHFFNLSLEDLKYSGIEESFNLRYKKIIKNFCPKSQISDQIFTKCYVSYNVLSYPKILFILFNLNYNELSDNKNIIVNFAKLNYILEHKIDHSLMGIISSPSSIHFTYFIINFEGYILDLQPKIWL